MRSAKYVNCITDEVNSTDVTHILNTEHRDAIKSLIDEYIRVYTSIYSRRKCERPN